MNPAMNAGLDLNDIILPQAIGWWPLAPGWWLLIAALLLTIVAVVLLWRRRQQRRRLAAPFRACENSLSALLENATELTPELCARINETLKILLRQTAPAQLSLHGDAWAEFLTGKAGVFSAEQLDALARGAYQSGNRGSATAMLAALRLWLKQAEAPVAESGRKEPRA